MKNIGHGHIGNSHFLCEKNKNLLMMLLRTPLAGLFV